MSKSISKTKHLRKKYFKTYKISSNARQTKIPVWL